MNDAAALSVADGALRLGGRVGFDNAGQVCDEGRRLLAQHPGVAAVDLSELQHAGSVVVAVLLVWSQALAGPMAVRHVPDSLRRVLEFTDMEDLFDLGERRQPTMTSAPV